MSKLSRFGVSLKQEILEKFDDLLDEKKYPTRSKAIEELIIQSLTLDRLSSDTVTVIGTINVVYDHHKRELLKKLTDIQHDFQPCILSSQHIHMDHHNCFEVIIFKGQKKEIEKLFSLVKGTKGILNASLSIFSV
ncbi:MAG: nickel-responsive transcriptional regulator NikR [Endomicrobia bacterium]|nr:nickel-responsive transcriptional regulator NikR [Endomicrobiia bacterium]